LHRDIDILTNDLWQIPYIVNKKNFEINGKIISRVKINDQLIAFDFKYPGDHYYDKKWAKNMLKNKIYKNDMYIPYYEDYFYGLIYHMLIHKEKISKDYVEKIKKNEKNNFEGNQLSDKKFLKKILDDFLILNNYQYTNSWKYKIFNNENTRMILVAVKIAKRKGIRSLFRSVKGKMYRTNLIKSGQI